MLHHMLRAAAARAFQTLDPYFQYVTMLLHGDGTNGAQNNTFLDSSTNNFTITRNGNTTQGTFTPYGSNWSNYFNGVVSANQSLTASPTAVGTSNLTVEFWFYYIGANSDSSDQQIYDTGTNGFSVYISGGAVNVYNRVASASIFGSSAAITANSWVHIAFVRSGTGASQTVLYVNGTSSATATLSTNFTSTTVSIGGRFAVSGASWNTVNGYVSNVRYNSTAVYSGAFTPSTTPLTAISGTVLLTCQSNRFIDNSTNAYTITVNSTPSVQRFSPFSPTTAYSTSVIGGSGYFDGSGDTLDVPTSTNNAIGTGSFCIEAWIYMQNASAQQFLVANASSGGLFIGFNIDTANRLAIGRVATAIDNEVTFTWVNNQWYHVVVNRNGTSLQFFVNGVQVGSTGSNSVNYLNQGYRVGSETTQKYFTGYMTDFRLTRDSVYTTTFTPNTTPLTAITNTAVLLNMTNGAIFDNAMMNDLETVGNAQISTSVKKYGTGSMSFNGSTDKLVSPYFPWMDFKTGDFTIEMWIYFNVALSSQTNNAGIVTYRSASLENTSLNLRCLTTNNIAIQLGATGSSFAWTPSATTWYHLALSRSGSNLYMFVNGTQQGSTATNSGNVTFETGYVFTIGGNPAASVFFNGYIDDLRITKGVARYTANFTAPTAAFPNN
jgi:hypothetical protein